MNKSNSDLQNHLKDYWEYRLKHNPTFATYIGDHRYDDALEDLSEGSIKQQADYFSDLSAQINKINNNSLTAESRLDQELIQKSLDNHTWEGHDWNQWRQVTTWQKPDLPTDQAGRRDLVPLLGSEAPAADADVKRRNWERRRDEYLKAVQAVLGTPNHLRQPPVEVRDLGREELEGYTRRHLLIRAEADDWIPAYLLVPKQLAAERVPAMLCLHQTVAQEKEEPCGIKGDPELAFAVELVRRGYVCLAPDVIGFGERIPAGKQPYHDSLAFYRRHPGWSFMGKMVWTSGG